MLNILQNIPDIKMSPLAYVFNVMKLEHTPDTLWLEFGVYSGKTINFISKYTINYVYGFDSFLGLPENWREGVFNKGAFNTNGAMPIVNDNVILLKGMFDKTLSSFVNAQNKKISFIHIDCDLYSSTKYVLDTLKPFIANKCVIVFDELVNYPGFSGDTGELKAFYEFVKENNVKFEWIGMNGSIGMEGGHHEAVALLIHSIG